MATRRILTDLEISGVVSGLQFAEGGTPLIQKYALSGITGGTTYFSGLTDVDSTGWQSGHSAIFDGLKWEPINYVSFSGIQVNASGGTIYNNIIRIQFLNSTVSNLGGGVVQVSGGGGGAGGATELTQLTDVEITSVASGHLLNYNGTLWVNEVPKFALSGYTYAAGSGLISNNEAFHVQIGSGLYLLNDLVGFNESGYGDLRYSLLSHDHNNRLALSGGTLTGQLNVNAIISGNNSVYGLAFWENGVALSGKYQLSGNYALSGEHALSGQSWYKAEADARFEVSGTMVAHIAAGDPHTQYLLESAAPGLYAGSGYHYNAGSGLISNLETYHVQIGSGLYLLDDLVGFNEAGYGDLRYSLLAHDHNNRLALSGGTLTGQLNTTAIISGSSSIYALSFYENGQPLADRYQASGLYETSGTSYTKAESESLYVNTTGDTMTGSLIISGNSAIRATICSTQAGLTLQNGSLGQYSAVNLTLQNRYSEFSGLYSIEVSKGGAGATGEDYFYIRHSRAAEYLDYIAFISSDNSVRFNDTKSAGFTYGDVYISNANFRVPSGIIYEGALSLAQIYQASGLYEVSGTSWTKSEADARYALSGLGLDDISGVVLTSPSNGQVLKYNGTNWINGTDETSAGSSYSGLTDVVDTSWTTGLSARFDGLNWQPIDLHTVYALSGSTGGPGATSFSGLTDVQDTGWTSGQIARYNGTDWVPYRGFLQFTNAYPTASATYYLEMAVMTSGGYQSYAICLSGANEGYAWKEMTFVI